MLNTEIVAKTEKSVKLENAPILVTLPTRCYWLDMSDEPIPFEGKPQLGGSWGGAADEYGLEARG